MGTPTPQGVTQLDRENASAQVDRAADVTRTTVSPENILMDFTDSFERYERENADAAQFNALKAEILETLNIVENNPGEPKAGEASRLDTLVEAVRSSNAPEELKVASENFFTAAIDNPALLSRLAGIIGGGSIAGVASVYNVNHEELEQQRSKEDYAYAAAAMAAYESARRVALALEGFNRNLASTLEDMRNGKISSEEASDTVVADLETRMAEAETPEEAVSIADGAIASVQSSGAPEDFVNPTISRIEELKAQMGAASVEANNSVKLSQNFMTAALGQMMFGLESQDPNVSAVAGSTTKEALLASITDLNAQNEAAISNRSDNLDVMEANIAVMRDELALARSNFERDAEYSGIEDIQQSLNDLTTQENELTLLEAELAEQREILALQTEVSELSNQYIDELMVGLNDDLSNLDVEFLKNAIVNADPALIEKSQQLEALTGNTGSDPISQLAAMASDPNNGMDPDKRAEITQFMNDLQSAIQQKAEADNLVAEKVAIVEAQNAMNPDGILSAGYDPFAVGTISPIATPEDNLRYALEQQEAAEEALNSVLGTDNANNPLIAVEAPPAPTPPSEPFVNRLTPEDAIYLSVDGDTISRYDAEEVLRIEFGLEGQELEAVLLQAAATLEAENGFIISDMGYPPPVDVPGLSVNGMPAPVEPEIADIEPEPEHAPSITQPAGPAQHVTLAHSM